MFAKLSPQQKKYVSIAIISICILFLMSYIYIMYIDSKYVQGPCKEGDLYVKGKCYAKCPAPDVSGSATTCQQACPNGRIASVLPPTCYTITGARFAPIIYKKKTYDPPLHAKI
jgi:hypothetical protein